MTFNNAMQHAMRGERVTRPSFAGTYVYEDGTGNVVSLNPGEPPISRAHADGRRFDEPLTEEDRNATDWEVVEREFTH